MIKHKHASSWLVNSVLFLIIVLQSTTLLKELSSPGFVFCCLFLAALLFMLFVGWRNLTANRVALAAATVSLIGYYVVFPLHEFLELVSVALLTCSVAKVAEIYIR